MRRTRGQCQLGHVRALAEFWEVTLGSSGKIRQLGTLNDIEREPRNTPALLNNSTGAPGLTSSTALTALAERIALTSARHSWNQELGTREGGAGSGTRRAATPNQRNAGPCAGLRLAKTTEATRRARHHLREAPRPVKWVAGKVSSRPPSSDPHPRGRNYYPQASAYTY